ncbi:MAG: hypothetical protein ACRDNJ_15835, partial [Solirubrobacteraceae bacterium]
PDQIKTECAAAGLPVIDSRIVPFDVVWRLAVPGPMIVRNPRQGGQRFRRKADTGSEGIRTVIPIDPGQP